MTVWLGLICAFSQLSSAAHLALVQHVRCAEHGEWVHAEQSHEGAHASEAEGSVSPAVGATDSSDNHDHDHCPVFSQRRELSLPLATLVELAAPLTDGVMPSRAPVDAPAPSGVYELAPKTSPPA